MEEDVLEQTNQTIDNEEQERARVEEKLRRKYHVPHQAGNGELDFGYRSSAGKGAARIHEQELGSIIEHEFITKTKLPRNEKEAEAVSTQEDVRNVLADFMSEEPVLSYTGLRERGYVLCYKTIR
ncbi:MAG: hypothetical protein ABIA93_01090 [Candidatus Woesearchaeota archaeon]